MPNKYSKKLGSIKEARVHTNFEFTSVRQDGITKDRLRLKKSLGSVKVDVLVIFDRVEKDKFLYNHDVFVSIGDKRIAHGIVQNARRDRVILWDKFKGENNSPESMLNQALRASIRGMKYYVGKYMVSSQN